MKRIIFVLTTRYPFDHGEEFFTVELEFLSNKFDHVYLIPVYRKSQSTLTRTLKKNVSVFEVPFHKLSQIQKILYTVTNFDILIRGLSTVGFSASQLLQVAAYIAKSCLLDKYLRNELDQRPPKSKLYFYSYWFNPIMVNVNLKKLGFLKVISRIHGSDLYEYIRKLPFRYEIYSKLDSLVSVSQFGSHYLKDLYPKLDNIYVSRLGVKEENIIPNTSVRNVIVSCSYCTKIKRIDRIIDALSGFSHGSKVKWVHIGSGPLFDELKRQASEKLAIDYEFLGYVPNDELVETYRELKPSLFINTSESEGIPVSMMESINLGIPIIALDVGAVREIVNSDTGFLLSSASHPKEIFDCINLAIKEKKLNSIRQSAKDFFSDHYDAKSNYRNFIKIHLS